MKVVVLGSTGMLGRYVFSYLRKSLNVIKLDRDTLNAEFISENILQNLFKKNNIQKGDVIINCVGIIKQRNDISNLEYVRVNSEFPLILANVCEKKEIQLIHITTDCVFNGLNENYDENSVHNPEDLYGKTKSIGEPTNCTVIRTSIIGEELKSGVSLIEWIKSNANKKVNGFTNHFWNGITCLQFAKICEKIINENLFWKGIRHIYSPSSVTKGQLIQIVSDIYNLNIKINLIEVFPKCDRTLSSIYPIIFKIEELVYQIKEQKDFYPNLI